MGRMNLEEFSKFEAEQERKQAKVKASYLKRGLVKDENDYMELHRAFSPYKVPRGLTKHQIRGKIAAFQSGRTKKFPLIANRISIVVNGKVMAGGSFVKDVPKNHRQLQNLLKAMLWNKR